MAILNLTPDSFSDGGRLGSLDAVLKAAEEAITTGADILDVGGESTRPGAQEIPVEEELQRVIPAIEALRREFPHIPISIDTRKAPVAEAAVQAGAGIINDVSGLQYDPAIADIAARYDAQLVIMHSQGTPDTMQNAPCYPNGVVEEVIAFFRQQTALALNAGVSPERIILDPGFGFGKTVQHNLTLLHYMDKLVALGYPVLAGTSRKSFLTLGDTGITPDQREPLTAASLTLAIRKGARMVRVHDVATQAPVVRLVEALSAAAQM